MKKKIFKITICLIGLLSSLFIKTSVVFGATTNANGTINYNDESFTPKANLYTEDDTTYYYCVDNDDETTKNMGSSSKICTFWLQANDGSLNSFRAFCLDGKKEYKDDRFISSKFKYKTRIEGKDLACAINSAGIIYSDSEWANFLDFNSNTSEYYFYIFKGKIGNQEEKYKPTTNFKNLQKKIWQYQVNGVSGTCANNNISGDENKTSTKYFVNDTWTATAPTLSITPTLINMNYNGINNRYEVTIPYSSSSGTDFEITAPTGFTCSKDSNSIFCYTSSSQNSGDYTLSISKTYSKKTITLIPFIDKFTNGSYQPVGYMGLKRVIKSDSYPKSDTVTLKIKGCQEEFQNLINNGKSSDKESRINLYKRYPNSKNLLNFNNYTNDAINACKSPTSCDSLSSGCLKTTLSTNFGSENLSCYQFTEAAGTGTLYCAITKLNLTNSLSTFKKNTVKAGQPIFSFTDNGTIATLNFGIECYGFTSSTGEISLGNYDKYVSSIKFGGSNLSFENDSVKLKTTNTSNSSVYKKYSYETSKDYSFPAKYTKLLTGGLSDSQTTNYQFLTYGPVSNLKETSGTKNLKFSMVFGSEISRYANITDKTDNSCKYTVIEEFLDDPKLNLEFRVIDADTTDVKRIFAGKTGEGRKIGRNWCLNNTNCRSDRDEGINNKINLSPITDGLNSYGRKPENGASGSPIYTITLDSETITKIRTYNSSHKYDEFDLEYDEDKNEYVSKFLKQSSIWNTTNLIRR